MSADPLVCAEVCAGRELRDGATVRRAGQRVLMPVSVARRLADDGVVAVLDDEGDEG